MQKFGYLFLSFTIFVSACASFATIDEPKAPRTDRGDITYTWSNFFNNDCGPAMKFKVNAEDEATLIYPCSNGKEISQHVGKHQRLSAVELWAASDLPIEQLNKLSNSKCRASLIYLGPFHVTIKFPCALIHLTVTNEIASRETSANSTLIYLNPQRVLITYGDGVQEFKVDDGRFTPLGPCKPFVSPESQFLLKNIPNNPRIRYTNLITCSRNQQM
jgi:hypothetical protein